MSNTSRRPVWPVVESGVLLMREAAGRRQAEIAVQGEVAIRECALPAAIDGPRHFRCGVRLRFRLALQLLRRLHQTLQRQSGRVPLPSPQDRADLRAAQARPTSPPHGYPAQVAAVPCLPLRQPKPITVAVSVGAPRCSRPPRYRPAPWRGRGFRRLRPSDAGCRHRPSPPWSRRRSLRPGPER